MGVLNWNKPKRAKTVQEWKEDYGFDGGPVGGYQPNMSDDDKRTWKAKITGQKLGYPQVEIRKTVGRSNVQLLIIVNTGKGYKYKSYGPDKKSWGGSTAGINVHVALNGGAQMTFKEMEELHQAIAEAKQALIDLEAQEKE